MQSGSDLPLLGNPHKDVVCSGHMTAAVIPAFCGFDMLGTIGSLHDGQGTGAEGEFARIDSGDMKPIPVQILWKSVTSAST